MRYSKLQDGSSAGKTQKVPTVTIVLVTLLCLLSFFYSQSFVTTLPATNFLPVGRSIQSLSSNEVVENVINITQDIENVLEEQRNAIKRDFKTYRVPNGKSNDSAKLLPDLTPETGGKPLRSVIIATWRSGSTFLGDVLNSINGNYYHYEPLLDHGIVQVRGPPLSIRAITNVKQLLQCNYTGMDEYLLYGQDHNWLFTHNTRLWDKCVAFPHLCWHAPFLNKFCSLFPFQSMKLVRLRLNLVEDLLSDQNLGIRVLLVVRDPRGIMQSRKHRDWCPGNPDCDDPTFLCADLLSDFSAALRLRKKFPNTFRAIRYEDISLNPYKGTQNLFKFFGLEFGAEVKKFLDTHTKINLGGVSSTFRNSRSAPFHWRTDLSYNEVEEIQNKCLSAMTAWGYNKAFNMTHQKALNPISKRFTFNTQF